MDEGIIRFQGRVAVGKGEATFFTQADWARKMFIDLVGIDPYPGTLNLIVSGEEDLAAWSTLRETGGVTMPAPDPGWCDGKLFPVRVAGKAAGAIVLPDVTDYAPGQVEIIAAVHLRTELGLAEGDMVSVEEAGPAA